MHEQQHYPYYPIPGAPPTPPPARKPPKRHRGRTIALATLGVIAALAAAGALFGGSDPGKTAAGRAVPVVSPSTTVNPPTVPAQPAASDPGPSYVTVNSHNITVTLKILTKDCFGSAGCNVTYRPQVTQSVPAGSFDPSVTWDVTYEVRGGSDGAQTGTLTVTGDSYESSEDLTQTGSQGVKLTAVITDIEPE